MYTALMQIRVAAEGEKFPVDFESLWPVVGYSRKDPATRLLVSVCVVDVDFQVLHQTVDNPQGGRAPDLYHLEYNSTS